MKDKIIIKCIEDFTFECCGKIYRINKEQVIKPCIVKVENVNAVKIGIRIDDAMCCIGGKVNGDIQLDKHFRVVFL